MPTPDEILAQTVGATPVPQGSTDSLEAQLEAGKQIVRRLLSEKLTMTAKTAELQAQIDAQAESIKSLQSALERTQRHVENLVDFLTKIEAANVEIKRAPFGGFFRMSWFRKIIDNALTVYYRAG